MAFIKHKWANILILCILVLGAWLRAAMYGNLNLSIGMRDTQSYIDSSNAPLYSREAFTGRRLFTTNLLYKLANDEKKCKLITISDPVSGREEKRTFQTCFNNIAVIQNLVSILGWCLLAWIISNRIKNPFYKIASAILILLFGFTPQIAEWDSILSSESLSLSLLPIVIALLGEIIFRMMGEPTEQSAIGNKLLTLIWLVIFLLWVFVRDVQLYAVLITIVLMLSAIFLKKIRPILSIWPILLLLVGIFILGNTTSRQSSRWQPSLIHAFDDFINPYPSRMEFMTRWGMPKDTSGAEYQAWFNNKALNAYGAFLVSHPGVLITAAFERSPYFSSDFIQPYFKTSEVFHRDILLIIGEALHPETNAIYILDFLLWASLCIAAYKTREPGFVGWAWLATWLFFYLIISLLISFFGDTSGTRRHIFPSVEGLRLFLWISLFVHLDLIGSKSKTKQQITNQ